MSGRYSIAWTSGSRQALARVPATVAAAAIDFVYGALAENPARVGIELRFALSGLRSSRRGDYRLIYQIDTEEQVATVVAIEHRADAYWPRSI